MLEGGQASPPGSARYAIEGRVHSAAQVGVANGGMHFYGAPHRSRSGHRARYAGGAAALLLLTGLAVFAVHSDKQTRLAPSRYAQALGPVDLYRVGQDVPKVWAAGRQQYSGFVPQMASIYAFQVYRCQGTIYQRAIMGITRIASSDKDAAGVAIDFSISFMNRFWTSTQSRIQSMEEISELSADGSHVDHGIQIDWDLQSFSPDVCVAHYGEMKCRYFDDHGTYWLVVLVASLDRRPFSGLQPTEADVQALLNDVVPG